jgi:thiol:disulfide interchange protein DsbA
LTFDPYISRWRQNTKSGLHFRRIHVSWDSKQRTYAQVYYTMQALGRDDLHEAVFKHVQQEHRPLYNSDDNLSLSLQVEFAQQNGIKQDDYTQAYHSSLVTEQLRRDANLLEALEITITPTNIVNRRFVTDPTRSSPETAPLPEQFSSLLELTDYLLSLKAT